MPFPWQRIEVNYTVATGARPDVKLAGANCGNSRVLLQNYLLDTTGQAERDELERTREEIDKQKELIVFWDHVQRSRAVVSIDPATGLITSVLPPSPNPPPPPPPVPDGDPYAPRHPPAPPELVSNAVQTVRLEERLVALEARRDQLALGLSSCHAATRGDGVVCGMTSNEAPDPWVGLEGARCRGYATRQARERDFCGYWDSEVNPLAADRKARAELLAVGPYCIGEDGKSNVFCSPNATRTQRSGVYDLEYMMRPDRVYCELQFSRERLASETGADIEACRANLTERAYRCRLSCDTCKSECTSKAARLAASLYTCTIGLPIFGLAAAFHSTDIGQDILSRWGGDRTKLQPPAPDKAWTEQFLTMVQNRIDKPIAPRSSISCRKSHRESSTGGFAPALDTEGKYIGRSGFLVGCKTDLDCASRCGEHVIHGSPYVCTHDLQLYSYAGYGKDVYNRLVYEASGARRRGEPHRRAWRPEPALHDFFLVEEAGDDEFDPTDGSTGVCTDVHINYGNTGCIDPMAAQLTMAVTGCAGRAAGWALLFCGATVVHAESDFVSQVGIEESSLLYPRTLVPGAQVNGKTRLPVTCWNMFDCNTKCEFYMKNARDGGLPAPEACALCRPPCPSDIGTWIVDVRQAIIFDVLSVLRLVAICLNPTACICQVMMMVRNSPQAIWCGAVQPAAPPLPLAGQALLDGQPAQRGEQVPRRRCLHADRGADHGHDRGGHRGHRQRVHPQLYTRRRRLAGRGRQRHLHPVQGL